MAIQRHIRHVPRYQDLSGQRFGRLTVLEYAGYENRTTFWWCQCDCGKRRKVQAGSLRSGNTKSCGCTRGEFLRAVNVKHGQAGYRIRGSQTTEYRTWCGMRRRCQDVNHQDYEDYGGRGIKICERWQSFENFFLDMGKKPSQSHSIERINNDGDYSPENCRWASATDQARNRRSNRLITLNGETMTLTEWCQARGIHYATVQNRLRNGWSLEQAVLTPIKTFNCWTSPAGRRRLDLSMPLFDGPT